MEGHSKAALSLRLSSTAIDQLGRINDILKGPSVNRLLHRMLVESLALADTLDFDGSAEAPLLWALRSQDKLRAHFAHVAQLELVTGVGKETRIVNVPTTTRNRETLLRFAHELRWSIAQTAAEALHAYAVLGGANKMLRELPPLLRVWRSLKFYDSKPTAAVEPKALDLERLNARLFRGAAQTRLEDGPRIVPMEVLVDLI